MKNLILAFLLPLTALANGPYPQPGGGGTSGGLTNNQSNVTLTNATLNGTTQFGNNITATASSGSIFATTLDATSFIGGSFSGDGSSLVNLSVVTQVTNPPANNIKVSGGGYQPFNAGLYSIVTGDGSLEYVAGYFSCFGNADIGASEALRVHSQGHGSYGLNMDTEVGAYGMRISGNYSLDGLTIIEGNTTNTKCIVTTGNSLFQGTNQGNYWAGNGAGLTNLNGATITASTVADAALVSTFYKANQAFTNAVSLVFTSGASADGLYMYKTNNGTGVGYGTPAGSGGGNVNSNTIASFQAVVITNGINTNNQYQLTGRAFSSIGLTNYPIPTLTPLVTTTNQGNWGNLAFDLMPSALAVDFGGNGVSWMDICNTNCLSNNPGVSTLRFQVSQLAGGGTPTSGGPGEAWITTLGFGGMAAEPLLFGYNASGQIFMNSTTAVQFNSIIVPYGVQDVGKANNYWANSFIKTNTCNILYATGAVNTASAVVTNGITSLGNTVTSFAIAGGSVNTFWTNANPYAVLVSFTATTITGVGICTTNGGAGSQFQQWMTPLTGGAIGLTSGQTVGFTNGVTAATATWMRFP